MARPNPVRKIMQAELPSMTYQKRKLFRPEPEAVVYAYTILNRYLFDNKLHRPPITQGISRKTWGVCQWFDRPQAPGTWCRISLSDKWFCQQWFLNTLAHEMAHQYQWDVYRWEHLDYYGRPMSESSAGHGPSFFMWRDRFADYGLTLKTSYGQRRWFAHQDFSRC
jgi:hypothetical protein